MHNGKNGKQSRLSHGFTLIELLVVLAIVALLLTVAQPRYFKSIDRAKEATLRQDLDTLRDGIDKFYADNGQYPDSLETLKARHYINKLPIDPMTESNETWVIIPPEPPLEGGVYDVKSGAIGEAKDGSLYTDW